ncbi:MAG TPA: PEP-CTERM sorting domain-containing protein [Paludibaculum sp.]|jgi:hypothetical protein
MKTIQVLGTLLLGASLSSASVILLPGNNPSGTEQNVLLNQGVAGTTVTGTFNVSPAIADFDSTQVITSPANGQARIQTNDGSDLTYLIISLQGGYTFGDLIFALNPPNGNVANPFVQIGAVGTLSGVVPLTASTQITTGNQFFTIRASGETMSSVTIQTLGAIGLGDIRQIRFSDITAPGGGGGVQGQIPEPATWALLGGGLVLLGLRRKLT